MSTNSQTQAIDFAATWTDETDTAASETLTAAQMINADVRQSAQTGAVAFTTDTAANIVAALGPGNSFDFVIVNEDTSSGVVTLNAGTGVTIVGTATVAVGASRWFKGIVTNFGTPAVSLISFGTLGAA